MLQNFGIFIELGLPETPNHRLVARTYFISFLKQLARRMDEFEIANGTCCEPSPSGGCSPIFSELAEILMEEEHIEKPKTPDEALAVYADLLRMIETIEAG